MKLDEMMNQFRLTSRELFNREFCAQKSQDSAAWNSHERFKEVEAVLFQKLVIEPASLESIGYGDVQTSIRVKLRDGVSIAPMMLNRDFDSGYWDHPIKQITADAELVFVCFFDWDQLKYRDNQYTRVKVIGWETNSGAVGKHALIETQYVQFSKR